MTRDLLTPTEQHLALQVLNDIDPDEEPLLRQLMRPEPRRIFRGPRTMGFGVNDVVEVVSPALLVIVPWAWSVFVSELQDQADDRLRKITRRALGPKAKQPPSIRPTRDLSQLELQALIAEQLYEYKVKPAKSLKIAEVLSRRLIEAKHKNQNADGL